MANKFLKLTVFVANCIFCGYGACSNFLCDESSEAEYLGDTFRRGRWIRRSSELEIPDKVKGKFRRINNSMKITARNIICIKGVACNVGTILYQAESHYNNCPRDLDPCTKWRSQNLHDICISRSITGVDFDCGDEPIMMSPPRKGDPYYMWNDIAEGNSEIRQVVFESGCEIYAIWRNAFYGCFNLQSICIPSAVEIIAPRAFFNCYNLSCIIFEQNSVLQCIEKKAFLGCSSLETIKIPEHVYAIEKSAFLNCSKLVSLEFLGSALNRLGKYVFLGCDSLKVIKIPLISAESDIQIVEVDLDYLERFVEKDSTMPFRRSGNTYVFSEWE